MLMFAGLFALPGCVGISGNKHTYGNRGGFDIGGALVEIDFKPEGTRPGAFMFSAMVVGAGRATFDGPFRWRVEAHGLEGVHEYLVVHRIRTRTEKTGRDEWFPVAELGKRAKFAPLGDQAGKSRARYPIPGLLKVKPEEDGKLEVWLDVSVSARTGGQRKLVKFELDPEVKDASDFVFLPTEVIENIGKSPDEWEDPMWD